MPQDHAGQNGANDSSADDQLLDLIHRTGGSGAFDGIVVSALPAGFFATRESGAPRQALIDASCELLVATSPKVRLFGPGAQEFAAFAGIAERELRTRPAAGWDCSGDTSDDGRS